jgi:hypothetical protein
MNDSEEGSGHEVIAVPQRDQISVYVNKGAQITISQRCSLGEDDSVVVIHPSDIPALYRALKECAKKIREGAG